ALPAQSAALDNLDFGRGTLDGWEGQGFTLGPGRLASSADADGKQAILHRTFVLPANAHRVLFRAAAFRPAQLRAGGALEGVLEAAEREMLPRRVRTARGWAAAPRLLASDGGRLRDYSWDVSRHAGRRVRIALVDSDDRPGCHVVCSGFRLE